MFSLRLRCPSALSETVCADLWDWKPAALGETEEAGVVTLLAGFTDDSDKEGLLEQFGNYSPFWQSEPMDWVAETQARWPPRQVGSKFLVCAPWNKELPATKRLKIVLNPGMASGTGEHPCTQLALLALESLVNASARVVDVGAGSGILAIGAAQLGATAAIALEPDLDAIATAWNNIQLNPKKPLLVAGSTDVLRDGWADVTVANISGTVLLSILEDLLRITAQKGHLILTGFEVDEAARFQKLFSSGQFSQQDGWACLSIHLT